MKKKLKLNELKVESFITDTNAKNVLGGDATHGCNYDSVAFCDPTRSMASPCLTIAATHPPEACAGTGTNNYNCPCDNFNLSHLTVCDITRTRAC